jgi:hypothetical protein
LASLLRQAATRFALVWCASALAGCGALPEDHAAADLIGRSGAGLRRTLERAPGFLADQERGLVRIGERLASLPGAAQDRTVRLGLGLADGARREADSVARSLPRASDGLAHLAERELRGARRLAADTNQFVSRLGRDATAAQRGAMEFPTRLHLSRDILPMPTDRERTVDLDPPARRRTLLERVLDRMSL